jgi:mono/diheme cytochrome c family protein
MAITGAGWKRRLLAGLVTLVVLGGGLAGFGWYKFLRIEEQPAFASQEEWFKYGSLGSEGQRGIPYWIWFVLPRIFPEFLPGPGGYKSFGLGWESGQEVPSGFAKKTVGFPRVTNNCAVCHTASYRTSRDDVPHLVAAGPGHTTNVQAMLRFLTRCAEDPRFNADVILNELTLITDLSFIDRQLYRWLIVPLTRKALLRQRQQFTWMNRHGWPDWGPGRDDPMNLTKYFMTSMPVDNSTGQADFPSVWNLKIRDGKGKYLNWTGDTPSPYSVIIDSALGLGAPAGEPFLRQMRQLLEFLRELAPPRYPFADQVDKQLAATGRALYATHCASCHAADGKRTNTVIPIEEIGTDRERMDTWTQAAADLANQTVKRLGIDRPQMVKQQGYLAMPLDGIWLRAPYLHNGSVPTLGALLEPVARRPAVFHRGYDLLLAASEDVGFVSSGPEAERVGFRFDTAERGNSNRGHLYGVDLPPGEKRALVEFLKTE